MNCDNHPVFDEDIYILQFREKALKNRIPLSGCIEITRRCNLNCIHCYIEKKKAASKAEKELDTNRWLSLIDEFVEAGCLKLLITGGEPFIRSDFPVIYRHAKSRGLLITVFTNGTLLDENILDLFSKLPPYSVEISLYGATSEVYERITGVPGSFEKCMQSIHELFQRKINLSLKSMMMTLNETGYPEIEKFSRDMGIRFRYDAMIHPGTNGNKEPLKYRVTPESAVKQELKDPKRKKEWLKKFTENQAGNSRHSLYNCSAGIISFYVNAYGYMGPCISTPSRYFFDLNKESFLSLWKKNFPGFNKSEKSGGLKCNECNKKIVCNVCPGSFELETGSENIPSEFACNLGKTRYQKILETIREEVNEN